VSHQVGNLDCNFASVRQRAYIHDLLLSRVQDDSESGLDPFEKGGQLAQTTPAHFFI
jgi:hypothetical protein